MMHGVKIIENLHSMVQIALRGVEWVHGLLFLLVLGKM